jgi:hypothetical protein
MRSCPVRASGSVIAWMGKAVLMPCSASAAQVCGRTPRLAKVTASSGSVVDDVLMGCSER